MDLYSALHYIESDGKLVLPKAKKGIFLLVDDLRMADQPGESIRGEKIAIEIGNASCNHRHAFGALISTTNAKSARQPASRWPVNWIPLRGATPEEAVSLFGAQAKDHEEDIRRFALLIGGDFGMLERAWNHISQSDSWDFSTLESVWIRQEALVPTPSSTLILDALRGRYYSLDSQNGEPSLGQWVERGVCFQPIMSGWDNHIPTLRLLSLIRAPPVLAPLTALLDTCLPPTNPSRMLTKFHLLWENLCRTLLQEEENPRERTLLDYYAVAYRNADTLRDHKDTFLPFLPKKGIQTVNTRLRVWFNAPQTVEALTEWMYVAMDTQDVVDSFYMEFLPNNELLLVAIFDVKYQDITLPDIRALSDQLLNMLFGQTRQPRQWGEGKAVYTLCPKDVVLIVKGFHCLPLIPHADIEAFEGFNVILLNGDRLRTLYTPTLLPLYLWWLDRSD